MLVMIKAILYDRTGKVCASIDFGKGLGRSEPLGVTVGGLNGGMRL